MRRHPDSALLGGATWIYDSCLDPGPGHSIFSCIARMVGHRHLALSATPPYVARGSAQQPNLVLLYIMGCCMLGRLDPAAAAPLGAAAAGWPWPG